MIELIRGLYNIKQKHHGCVVSIGNFDGLHQGHQALIQKLVDQGKRLYLPTCIVLFEPHPQEYFLKEKAPARLMRLREKIKIFRDLSVDRILCLKFNAHLAEYPADSFVKKILVDCLGVKVLTVGDDFRFGKGRQGDFNGLQHLGKQYDFKVYSTPTVLFENERVGSSRVRNALKQGHFEFASRLLTRPFTFSGRVRYGDQRGRLLGFPTANIDLHRYVVPLEGVFIVRVYGIGEKPLTGVANCGRRPTINGVKNLLEIHLFNFEQDIYGYTLEIEFLKKIRTEKKFESLQALKEQISHDVMFAKNYFKKERN